MKRSQLSRGRHESMLRRCLALFIIGSFICLAAASDELPWSPWPGATPANTVADAA